MMKLSFWAKRNPIKAIWISFLLQIFQIPLGVYVGFWLFANNISIAGIWTLLLSGILLVSMSSFPLEKNRRSNYKVRKYCEIGVSISVFLLTIAFSNSLPAKLGIGDLAEERMEINEPKARFIVFNHPGDMDSKQEADVGITNKKPKSKKREWKAKLKSEILKLKKDGELNTADLLKIVGIVFLGIIVGILFALFSCAIGWVVRPILGLVVFSAGTALLVLGMKRWIRHIRRKAERRDNKDARREKRNARNKNERLASQ